MPSRIAIERDREPRNGIAMHSNLERWVMDQANYWILEVLRHVPELINDCTSAKKRVRYNLQNSGTGKHVKGNRCAWVEDAARACHRQERVHM